MQLTWLTTYPVLSNGRIQTESEVVFLLYSIPIHKLFRYAVVHDAQLRQLEISGNASVRLGSNNKTFGQKMNAICLMRLGPKTVPKTGIF